MDIRNSKRILILGARESGALDIVRDLTGAAPQPDIHGSIAGLTHEWHAQTPYYSAKVPIWIDEVSDAPAWKADFLRDEAREVVEAVGAWIFCFQRPGGGGQIGEETRAALKGIQEVIERHPVGAEAVLLAVAKAGGKDRVAATEHGTEEQEDLCMEYGFEYIDYAAEGKNEFGEKVGLERLKEALEANEWAAEDDEADLDDLDFDGPGDLTGFDREEAEMTAELFGMKAALNAEEIGEADEPEAEDFVPAEQQAGQVDDLDRIMGRLLAIKEQSADLPEAQRKRMAAQAVKDLLKDRPNV